MNHVLIIQRRVQESRNIWICEKKEKSVALLQGATFCFVEEGDCSDQLRAKYQYPGIIKSTSIQVSLKVPVSRCHQKYQYPGAIASDKRM